MSLFGVAIYLHLASEEELKKYIELLAKYQVKIIFTTLVGCLESRKKLWEKLSLLSIFAKKQGMNFYLAIDNTFLNELGLANKKPKEIVNFFRKNHLAGIFCAEDISLELQAKLTHNNHQFKIIINGSYNIMQLEKLILNYLINSNNVVTCYNFYPQRYTGASVDFYLINQYKSHINNIPFAGFVSLSPETNRQSLPSIEIHRDWSLSEQIHHLIALSTDIILIAKQFLKETDLKLLQAIDEDKVTLAITIAFEISEAEKIILFDEKIHFVQPDLSQNVIRSTKINHQDLIILPRVHQAEYFEVGDVVILNQTAKNATHELQIVIKKMKNDGIRNFVAKIKEPYRTYFLSELKATRQFKFI